MSAVLGIVNNISKRVQLTNLNNLIKSFSKWILTGILTVFTGINAIYEMQLRSVSTQIGTIDQVHEQTRRMARQIEELNEVYARMLQAMTSK